MFEKVSYLTLIKRWSKTGLPNGGLCNSLSRREKEIFNDFYPTEEDMDELIKEGLPHVYWGAGRGIQDDNATYADRTGVLTPLRETILCFCAAINEEL